jgi:mRNA-degrading endonuclease RelE of RelBE toxin-antitoxin system
MRSPRNIHRPFTVEIVTDAWAQVSQLPRDTYRAVQARLESLAAHASEHAAPSSEGAAEERPRFSVGDLTIHYVVDARRRVIQLVRISRERSTSAVSRSRRDGTPS